IDMKRESQRHSQAAPDLDRAVPTQIQFSAESISLAGRTEVPTKVARSGYRQGKVSRVSGSDAIGIGYQSGISATHRREGIGHKVGHQCEIRLHCETERGQVRSQSTTPTGEHLPRPRNGSDSVVF